jgi:phospholipid/cholesterol/gamma-HCH transport system substrate-binding protein
METRAPYALIGLFVLAAIGAAFGFVFWLHNTGGLGERAVYRVRFENTVSGLLTGAAVLFNGIRVGEVTDLGLNPDNPREVMATITVAATTPVRADTQAGLEFQGLTGVPVISLQGGDPKAAVLGAALSAAKDGPPVLAADPSAGQSMTEAARQALRRLDTLVADNSDNLKSSIANLNTFTGALARNSDRVDAILSGLERMTGGGGSAKVAPEIFDLVAPVSFPPAEKTSTSQLVVAEPTSVVALDTQKIIVAPGAGESLATEVAEWSDTVPKLLQAMIIQSFENSNYLGAVARPTDNLTFDYQLLLDLRIFQIERSSADSAKPIAHVAFAAKILGNQGRIVASRTFNAQAARPDTNAPGAVAALNDAFRQAATQLVEWTASAI